MRTPKFFIALTGIAELLFNTATTLATRGDLDIGGVHVPAGTYTLYVLVRDPENRQLIVNRQTTASGNTGTIRLEWENHVASVPIRVA